MVNIEEIDRLYDTLFELSNDIRHNILLLISEKPIRMTNIAKRLELTSPEVSRHLSRLSECKLIQKDLNNLYHLTDYGSQVLILVKDLEFTTKNRDYFVSHNTANIPPTYRKRLPELSEYQTVDNFMGFLTFIDKKIKGAKEFVWLCIDQYPLIAVDSMLSSVERKVKIRIIEPVDLSGPKVTFEDRHLIALGSDVPDVIVKKIDNVDVYLFVSDVGSAVSFPTGKGFDYSGFLLSERISGGWIESLFNNYWENALDIVPSLPREYKLDSIEKGKSIIVDALLDPELNTRAIQNAVDNFDEVLLRGQFTLTELGIRTTAMSLSSTVIKIKKSVLIRGEGREDDIPSTTISKNNWKYPFADLSSIFEIDRDNIDVTIENIHFKEFNGASILCSRGNRVNICNNRVTIPNGIGKGITYPDREDSLIGFCALSYGQEKGGFPGGVVIEGNYLDFLEQNVLGGYFVRKGENDPEFRPDLEKHEDYNGYGIIVLNNHGDVTIRDNFIRNTNSRGILVTDNADSSNIRISGNTIISDIPGCYPQSLHYAGVGIVANASYGGYIHSGSSVYIVDNDIHCTNLNYCGIAIYGQSTYVEGAGKFAECVVENNRIHLDDGFVGLLIRTNDETEVFGNKISGKAYYGFHLWGSKNQKGFDLNSSYNVIKDNDLSNLEIKPPDTYSDNHVDGEMFSDSDGKSKTAHYWLNKYSNRNEIHMNENEYCIDEGKENKIIHN